MTLGVHCVFEPTPSEQRTAKDQLVDVVAIHDIAENATTAWTSPRTGRNWLRDFLPLRLPTARILTYGYDGTANSFFADDAVDQVRGMAQTLMQELHADRSRAGALKRPLVFICHGLGGVLLKESLVYSSTRKAYRVEHLLDQYMSTSAILFFGTPHDGATSKSLWLAYEQQCAGSPRAKSVFLEALEGADQGVQVPRRVAQDFAPLARRYRLFFFWELQKTNFGRSSVHIVPRSSAVPNLDDAEPAGLNATHSLMVKFAGEESSDYRMVLDALDRSCQEAPGLIARRWAESEAQLAQIREADAREMMDLHLDIATNNSSTTLVSETLDQARDADRCRHFDPPPSTTNNYIGRDTLILDIARAFFDSRDLAAGVPKCFIIHGMGGSGKTQLATRFAHEYRHEYVAVFTIKAANKKTIEESYCQIGKLGGMHPTQDAGRYYLAQLTEPWLLIIDNADNPEEDIHQLFPQSNYVHILVTTRSPNFIPQSTVGAPIELSGLREDEALKLLLTSANVRKPWSTKTRDIGNEITKALGYLALAIIQAGKCIVSGGCKLPDYLTRHKAERLKVQNRKFSNAGDEMHEMLEIVYATFDLSLESLTKVKDQRRAQRRRDAGELLRVLAFYHFDSVPVDIFRRAFANRFRSVDDKPARSYTAVLVTRLFETPEVLPSFLRKGTEPPDQYRINDAVSHLRSHSFISVDEELISLHPQVHEWARDSLFEGTVDRQVWAAIAVNTILESISLPGDRGEPMDPKYMRDILPHLDAGLEECQRQDARIISPSILNTASWLWKASLILFPIKIAVASSQIRSAAKCGVAYGHNGQFEKAATYLKMARDVLMKLAGENNDKTIAATLGLAGVYWGLDRPDDAIALQKRVVTIATKVRGPLHDLTLRARNALGRSYWLSGRHEQALTLQKTTVDQMEDSSSSSSPLPEDAPLLLEALDHLGVTLKALHRFDESLALHSRVLTARLKSQGASHADTLLTKHHRAMTLRDLGRLDEAHAIMTAIHGEQERQLGKEHPWTLWALCDLSKVKTDLGLLDEAEILMLWGIEAAHRSLGGAHAGVSMGYGELARVLARQGRFEEAEAMTGRALRIVEASAGGRPHPDYMFGLLKLAQLRVMMGRRGEAAATCREAMGLVGLRVSGEHPISRAVREMLDVLMDPGAGEAELARFVPQQQSVRNENKGAAEEVGRGLGESSTPTLRNASKLRTATW